MFSFSFSSAPALHQFPSHGRHPTCCSVRCSTQAFCTRRTLLALNQSFPSTLRPMECWNLTPSLAPFIFFKVWKLRISDSMFLGFVRERERFGNCARLVLDCLDLRLHFSSCSHFFPITFSTFAVVRSPSPLLSHPPISFFSHPLNLMEDMVFLQCFYYPYYRLLSVSC